LIINSEQANKREYIPVQNDSDRQREKKAAPSIGWRLFRFRCGSGDICGLFDGGFSYLGWMAGVYVSFWERKNHCDR